ncbi:MAG: transposase [Lachnospiraceae bacterium]|nr:transposase [Lachnospiraceae bacterium]
MKILQAFKFQLKSHTADVTKLRQFAGAWRFVWNKALELEKKRFESSGKYLGYNKNAGQLKEWKNLPETAFLSDVHSQILQQKLKDLDRVYQNFFEGRADLPKFKKRGLNDSFRYPQGFKVDENNNRVYLPKIGWVSYRKSRIILGTPKQMTISCKCGKWYVSIQTERYVDDPVHPFDQEIGIDMGIKKFAAMSDETFNKLTWFGGRLVLVSPRNTSLTCKHCRCIDKGNRASQAQFKCVNCGDVDNADFNAAKNILAAGQAVLGCYVGRAQASVLKQEPACGTR